MSLFNKDFYYYSKIVLQQMFILHKKNVIFINDLRLIKLKAKTCRTFPPQVIATYTISVSITISYTLGIAISLITWINAISCTTILFTIFVVKNSWWSWDWVFTFRDGIGITCCSVCIYQFFFIYIYSLLIFMVL